MLIKNTMCKITNLPIIAFSLLSATALGGPIELAPVDEVYPIAPNWHGINVLHIGDSHVSAGLRSGLERQLKRVGANYHPVCWSGSRSKSWITSGRLKRLLKKHHPAVVIVTLGTNAMQHERKDLYSVWIRALAKQLNGRICYWLGPPPLIDDLIDFNRLLRVNSAPCRYFDSRVLGTPKRKDGKFHMTRTQGETWADTVWRWMNSETTIVSSEEADAL